MENALVSSFEWQFKGNELCNGNLIEKVFSMTIWRNISLQWQFEGIFLYDDNLKEYIVKCNRPQIWSVLTKDSSCISWYCHTWCMIHLQCCSSRHNNRNIMSYSIMVNYFPPVKATSINSNFHQKTFSLYGKWWVRNSETSSHPKNVRNSKVESKIVHEEWRHGSSKLKSMWNVKEKRNDGVDRLNQRHPQQAQDTLAWFTLFFGPRSRNKLMGIGRSPYPLVIEKSLSLKMSLFIN